MALVLLKLNTPGRHNQLKKVNSKFVCSTSVPFLWDYSKRDFTNAFWSRSCSLSAYGKSVVTIVPRNVVNAATVGVCRQPFLFASFSSRISSVHFRVSPDGFLMFSLAVSLRLSCDKFRNWSCMRVGGPFWAQDPALLQKWTTAEKRASQLILLSAKQWSPAFLQVFFSWKQVPSTHALVFLPLP